MAADLRRVGLALPFLVLCALRRVRCCEVLERRRPPVVDLGTSRRLRRCAASGLPAIPAREHAFANRARRDLLGRRADRVPQLLRAGDGRKCDCGCRCTPSLEPRAPPPGHWIRVGHHRTAESPRHVAERPQPTLLLRAKANINSTAGRGDRETPQSGCAFRRPARAPYGNPGRGFAAVGRPLREALQTDGWHRPRSCRCGDPEGGARTGGAPALMARRVSLQRAVATCSARNPGLFSTNSRFSSSQSETGRLRRSGRRWCSVRVLDGGLAVGARARGPPPAKSESGGRSCGTVWLRSVSLGSSRFPRDVFVRGAERRSATATATGQPRAAATRTTALAAHRDLPVAAAIPVA